MRIETKDGSTAPVGLIMEEDLIHRFPDRKADIIKRAITTREERLLTLKAARSRFGWHPAHTAKVLVVSALATFVLAYLFSLVSSFGHFYAQAKAMSIDIAVPVIGSQHVAIGSFVPTSTPLGIASMIPQYGIWESVLAGLVVAALVIIERLLLASANYSSVKRIKAAERRIGEEIKSLRTWTKG